MKPKGDVTDEELSAIYIKVFDDFFVKMDNPESFRYLELVEITECIPKKIKAFKAILYFHNTTPKEIWNHPTVKAIRDRHIEKMNPYLDDPIDIEADFTDEIHRTVTVTLSIMELDYKEAMMELEDMRAKAAMSKFEFQDDLQNLNEANGTSMRPDITLAEYVAAVKSRERKINRNNGRK